MSLPAPDDIVECVEEHEPWTKATHGRKGQRYRVVSVIDHPERPSINLEGLGFVSPHRFRKVSQ